MSIQTGMTLDELDDALKAYLLITDNAAAHWDTTERRDLLNRAQNWVQRKALSSHYERRTEFFLFNTDGTSGTVLLPADIIVEVALYKWNGSKSGDAAWEQIRLIRPEEEHKWQNTGSEEVWVSERGKIRAKGSAFPTGGYRLQYIQRVPDLANTSDVCQLSPDLHEYVWLRAAQKAAEATNDATLANRAIADLADWVEQLQQQSGLFAELRSGATTPRLAQDFTDGSLFRLMERLRVRMAPSVGGDKLTRDLLVVMLNDAQQRIALTIKSVFSTHMEKAWIFDMGNGASEILLPRGFKSHILLQHQTTADAGNLGWVEVPIVRSIDQELSTYSFLPQVVDSPNIGAPVAAIISDNKLRFLTSQAPTGTFRMTYIATIVPLMADEDECVLDVEYQQAVIVEAAKDIAAMFGLREQQAYFQQQADEWYQRLIADASRRSYRTYENIQDTMGWSNDGDGLALPYGI
ncbi:MAG: hypothetical protein IPK26_26315 [Planctomycetes bacterium]|nr:hypothetical protein [Planctomycetota bacterium]